MAAGMKYYALYHLILRSRAILKFIAMYVRAEKYGNFETLLSLELTSFIMKIQWINYLPFSKSIFFMLRGRYIIFSYNTDIVLDRFLNAI